MARNDLWHVISLLCLAVLAVGVGCAPTKLPVVHYQGMGPSDPGASKITCERCINIEDRSGKIVAASERGTVLTDVYFPSGRYTVKFYECSSLVAHRPHVYGDLSFQAEAGKSYELRAKVTSKWGANRTCRVHWVQETATGKVVAGVPPIDLCKPNVSTSGIETTCPR